MSYSRHEVLRLAAEVGCDPRTVEKWLRSEDVQRPIAYALAAAAKKLDLPRPSTEAETSSNDDEHVA